MQTREDKRMVKLVFFFSKLPFWGIYKQINTFIFWCMVSPLGPHPVMPITMVVSTWLHWWVHIAWLDYVPSDVVVYHFLCIHRSFFSMWRKNFWQWFAILHCSTQYMESQVFFLVPCALHPLLVTPNDDNIDRIIRILSLMEISEETQAQSNTLFFKDFDYNTLPQQSMKFLPHTFNDNIMFELPPWRPPTFWYNYKSPLWDWLASWWSWWTWSSTLAMCTIRPCGQSSLSYFVTCNLKKLSTKVTCGTWWSNMWNSIMLHNFISMDI